MRLFLMAFLLSGFSLAVQACKDNCIFEPQVTISKDSSSDIIEIQVEQVSFITTYTSQKQAMRPVYIPFKVRSVDGNNLSYRITLSRSLHFCGTLQNGDKSLNSDVVTFLDTELFPLVGTEGVGGKGYVIENVQEQSHVLSVTFKENSIPQLSDEQVCHGLLGVTAGVEL